MVMGLHYSITGHRHESLLCIVTDNNNHYTNDTILLYTLDVGQSMSINRVYAN